MHMLITIVAKDLIVVSFLAVGIVFLVLKPDHRLHYVGFVVISTISTIALVKLASHIHHDPRPFLSDGVTAYFKSARDNGFPSDHTVASAFSALIVLRYYRKAGLALFALAIAIGWARVVGNVHHAQDIVAGTTVAILGVGIGYLCSKRLFATAPASVK